MINKPKAIIFDMDGVIVDSMPYHFISWYEALRPEGVRVTCFDVYAKEGERWEKTIRDFLRRESIRPTPEVFKRIYARKQKYFRQYFKPRLFKGMEEFIACLKHKGYKLGLVTGTPAQDIKAILPVEIISKFDIVVAGDSVKKGKPHPEPYLTAAKLLELDPAKCVVIENAPYGIESAKRAGMFCIALATSLPKEYLTAADVVVNRLKEVTRIIGKTCVPKRVRLSERIIG
ncbi:MAG: HAD family phosphatase [Candidatus Omnitrophota bacterium]